MSSPFQGSDTKQREQLVSETTSGVGRNVSRINKPPESPEEGEVRDEAIETKSFSRNDDADVDDEKTEEEQENSSQPDTTSTEGDSSEKEKVIGNSNSGTKSKGKREPNPSSKKSGDGEEEVMDEDKDDDTEMGDDERRGHDKGEYMEMEGSGGIMEHGEEVAKMEGGLTDNRQNNVDAEHKKADDGTGPLKEIQTTGITPAVTALRESFLSDSLTEEERRTRTRYIPAVEGMSALKKIEVKHDLILARTFPGTVNNSKSTKTKQLQRDSQSEDIVMEEVGTDESEQAVSKESNKNQSLDEEVRKMILLGNHLELVVPSPAFRPPLVEGFEADDSESEQIGTKRPAPYLVDSITAFSPPRLPESVSAKKKHRMARWQHNPAVMDIDLSIYHKTVQKQREALKHAELEFQRVQTVDNHLRRHFLQQIRYLNEEMALVSKDLAAEQHKCVKATEWYLPTSRLRGRNDEKTGSKAMKDIFHGLRRLDIELRNKREVLEQNKTDKFEQIAGVGGVSGESFMEWQRSTKFKPSKLAAAWVIPNDKVVIPSFGGIQGTVMHFFPYATLDPNEEPHVDLFPKKKIQRMEVDYSYGNAFSRSRRTAFVSKQSPQSTKQKSATSNDDDQSSFKKMLPPRFAIQLPFGVGFFSVASVVSTEDPSTYTNDKLAARWKRLIETASVVAPTLDIGAMFTKTADEVNAAVREFERSLIPEESREQPRIDDHSIKKTGNWRVVPLGADLLPTAAARGAHLEKASLAELNHSGSKLFYGAKAVLGNPDNVGVPTEVRKLEDQNQEFLNTQAQVLQLRNQLYRQRRIRYLNEKTLNATKERAAKVESLVTEMRTDLKILKARLDEEIRELGISEETAERILSSYYSSLDVTENQSSKRRQLTPTAVEEEVE